MTQYCIAVVGPGESATQEAIDDALLVGRRIAERGWVMICGGRATGVMAAAARGAKAAGGLSIGILPGADRAGASEDLTLSLPTALGEARNAVIVTAADAVVACGMNPGTASEVSLALRAGKPTVLVRPAPATAAFFAKLGLVYVATSADDAIDSIAPRLR
ncbi:MAG TPA: hypothetical protein VGJ18_01185 [Gemmatimonadaceae bacterium]|jgi:hypothetical protein